MDYLAKLEAQKFKDSLLRSQSVEGSPRIGTGVGSPDIRTVRLEKGEATLDYLKKKKSIKKGKLKRHFQKRSRLDSPGFGCPWQDEAVWFRVEFSYWDRETDEEDNFQTHWVACRRFKGKERQHLNLFIESQQHGHHGLRRTTARTAHAGRETRPDVSLQTCPQREILDHSIESRYVCVYVCAFVCGRVQGEKYDCAIAARNAEVEGKINQAFIFPAAKKNDSSIRYPIYQIRWSEKLGQPISKGVRAALNNSIRHEV